MKKMNPEKIFVPAPPIDSTCGCSDCKYMKLHTVRKIFDSLNEEKFEVDVDPAIREKAVIPIRRMLEISG